MFRQSGTAATVCLVCVATVAAHTWIARHLEPRIVTGSDLAIPILDPIEGGTPVCFHPDLPSDEAENFSGLMWCCPEIPDPDEVMASLSDDDVVDENRPRMVISATFENTTLGDERPADALQRADRDEPTPIKPAEKPLSRRQQQEQAAVRDVIEEEMPETSAEERDIWYEELKSLPAEIVRDMLQVRKQLRVLSPDHAFSGPAPLHPHAPPHRPLEQREIVAEPVTQSRPLQHGDWTATRHALEQAIAWSTHNIANAATPGYKRIEVTLGDVYRHDHPNEFPTPAGSFVGQGCKLSAVRVDMTPGELRATGRELDLSIDGAGFFIVSCVDGPCDLYARNIRLSFDNERRLCVIRSDGRCFLSPITAIPEDAVKIEIAGDGTISVRRADQSESERIGQFDLATFKDTSGLIPVGNGAFKISTEVPQHVKPGSPGAGLVRQGFQEGSNVDVDREQTDRETWESILRSLPATEIPRTAREGRRSPN